MATAGEIGRLVDQLHERQKEADQANKAHEEAHNAFQRAAGHAVSANTALAETKKALAKALEL